MEIALVSPLLCHSVPLAGTGRLFCAASSRFLPLEPGKRMKTRSVASACNELVIRSPSRNNETDLARRSLISPSLRPISSLAVLYSDEMLVSRASRSWRTMPCSSCKEASATRSSSSSCCRASARARSCDAGEAERHGDGHPNGGARPIPKASRSPHLRQLYTFYATALS